VSDIVAEIAAASREQSSGIEQVNKAVMQMDEMTQQNASLVEEATAASQAMAQQAAQLNELMERFRLSGSDQAARPAAAGKSRTAAAAASEPVERRAGDRPWSKRAAPVRAAESSSGRAAQPRVAVSADSDWENF
jgi:hypothetical protein